MTATITSTRQISATGYRVEWQSDQANPQFWIYQDGMLANQTTQTSGTFSVENGSQLTIEVFDNATAKPTTHYPGKIALHWYGVTGAVSYRIDQLIGATWVKKTTIPDDARFYYKWISLLLDDCTLHQFRVVPIGENGIDGTPAVTAGYIVRFPNIPKVAYSYNATDRTLTLSAG